MRIEGRARPSVNVAGRGGEVEGERCVGEAGCGWLVEIVAEEAFGADGVVETEAAAVLAGLGVKGRGMVVVVVVVVTRRKARKARGGRRRRRRRASEERRRCVVSGLSGRTVVVVAVIVVVVVAVVEAMLVVVVVWVDDCKSE